MPERPTHDSTRRGVRAESCRRYPDELEDDRGRDDVVVEEPLEIRIESTPLATVMRTPGDDRDLTLGFLFGEGIIETPGDVGALAFCERDGESEKNVATLNPREGLDVSDRVSTRYSPSVSSCGVCGKRSIEEALRACPPPGDATASLAARPWLDPDLLVRLPARLLEEQTIFSSTGALHAAGAFDSDGAARWIREDIGRHNAVDKVVGAAFHEGALPLSSSVLLVSGRVSFEIVQKAYRAGISVVSAVSGVSSLAVQMAREVGMSLAGFVRDGRFNLYVDGGHLKLDRSATI